MDDKVKTVLIIGGCLVAGFVGWRLLQDPQFSGGGGGGGGGGGDNPMARLADAIVNNPIESWGSPPGAAQGLVYNFKEPTFNAKTNTIFGAVPVATIVQAAAATQPKKMSSVAATQAFQANVGSYLKKQSTYMMGTNAPKTQAQANWMSFLQRTYKYKFG